MVGDFAFLDQLKLELHMFEIIGTVIVVVAISYGFYRGLMWLETKYPNVKL